MLIVRTTARMSPYTLTDSSTAFQIAQVDFRHFLITIVMGFLGFYIMSALGRQETFNRMVNCLATLVSSPAGCGQL